MRILIVEDSPADRELLRCNIENQLKGSELIEADNLNKARGILKRGGVDCVLLDLQLPDSAGKETFERLIERFPDVPIIVMTNNTDRELALGMIRNGAADFLIKDFTNEDRLCRQILYAVEKYQRSIQVHPEAARLVHQLDRAKASMLTAHQSGEHLAVVDTNAHALCPIHQRTVDMFAAMADTTRHMCTELQALRADMNKRGTQQNQDSDTVEQLKVTVLEGTPDRPSLMSGVAQLQHRVSKSEARQVQSKLMVITKVLLALLTLVLLTIAGTVAYKQITGEDANHAHRYHRLP